MFSVSQLISEQFEDLEILPHTEQHAKSILTKLAGFVDTV